MILRVAHRYQQILTLDFTLQCYDISRKKCYIPFSKQVKEAFVDKGIFEILG